MKCNTSCPLPMPDRSLYDDRIYDEHENYARCYENNPVQVVEQFQMPTDKKTIFKWIIAIIAILLVAFAVYYYACRKEVINFKIPTPQTGGNMTSSLPFTF